MELLGNFGWWMASWQHGLSGGLGFCSYRPLFIPRCQSLYRNQLINPASPFLSLFPPFLPPQSSLLSLSWCEGSLPSFGGKLSWSRSETENRGQPLSQRGWLWVSQKRSQHSPGSRPVCHPGCSQAPAPLSQLDHRLCLNRKDFLKSCQALAGVLSG